MAAAAHTARQRKGEFCAPRARALDPRPHWDATWEYLVAAGLRQLA